ncbi:hypothetical protein [Pelagerythrobacter aerophilus]
MADVETKDLSAKRLPLFAIWIVPMVLLFALNFTAGFFAPSVQTAIAAVLLAWMGSACTLNAVRCRRLHCIIAGPAFLIGALLLALIALDGVNFGRDGPNFVIWGTFAIVALSFVPEWIFGRYTGARS